MATVIDFTARLNERRASAKQAELEQARQALVDSHMDTAREAAVCGDTKSMLQHVVAAVEVQENANKFMPAYCDPANEFKGSKYEATKRMSTPEIAKLIREDIKAAKKRGQLPAALKLSVRSDSFSGGSSIDIVIKALPEGQQLFNPEWMKATDNGKKYNEHNLPRYTKTVRGWIELLKEIHRSYNRDNSDHMTDYFSVNYYGDVSVSWKLEG